MHKSIFQRPQHHGENGLMSRAESFTCRHWVKATWSWSLCSLEKLVLAFRQQRLSQVGASKLMLEIFQKGTDVTYIIGGSFGVDSISFANVFSNDFVHRQLDNNWSNELSAVNKQRNSEDCEQSEQVCYTCKSVKKEISATTKLSMWFTPIQQGTSGERNSFCRTRSSVPWLRKARK